MLFRRAAGCIKLAFIALLFSSMAFAQDATNGTDAYPKVLMRTSMGDMVIELDRERAPASVENFLAYADANYYTDTVFHRVIEGFMIQGGGFTTSFQRKTTRPPVDNEAYNGLRNNRYTIAMARTTAPHSATSQFFINSNDNQNLNHTGMSQRGWGYTVFGRVIEGKDVVDAISRVRTGPSGPFSRDVPKEAVVILSVDRLSVKPAEGALPAAPNDVPVEENVEGAASATSANTVIQSAQSGSGTTKIGLTQNQSLGGVSNAIIKQN